MHRINGKDFREAVASLQSGSTRLRISRKNLARIHFLLPPLDEQRRIVAEIEKQFSRLDEAVANLQRVKANLKRYKAAILKAAVEGRLVETEASLAHREGRTYETGVDLLALMLSAQGELKQGRGRKSNSSDAMGGANATLPDGWVWATLGQFLSERIVNGLSIKESTDPTEVRALRLSAMRGESIDFTDFRYLPISPYKVHDILIQAGDVFVSRGNGSLDLVGRACTAGTPPLPTIFPDTMMRLRFTQTAPVAAWVRAIWHSRSIREQIESRVKTTAGIYKIAQPELASVLVPLPPLAEQKRITTESDRRLSFLRVVEAEVDANLLRAQRLRQATLSKAFVPNESK
jgi:type I restriction enzyme S subunit